MIAMGMSAHVAMWLLFDPATGILPVVVIEM
jgi:hypothetical protein